MSRERELLERSAEILELLFEGPNDVDPNTLAMLGDTRLEEIRAYLASEKQDQPEPVQDEPFAYYDMQKHRFEFAKPTKFEGVPQSIRIPKLPLYLHPEKKQDERVIPMAWSNLDGTKFVGNGEKWKHHDCQVPLYLHPAPQKGFVRLTEEEVNSLTYAPLEPYELICAVENRLAEKNK